MGRGAQLTTDDLIEAAKAAARNAYAPYSDFHVGAAVLTNTGEVITAANFENASYGLSLCAETLAIASANSAGHLERITDIAIAGGAGGSIGLSDALLPCGRCRQVIAETAQVTGRDIAVHCAHADGYDTHLISNLLPNAFGQHHLT